MRIQDPYAASTARTLDERRNHMGGKPTAFERRKGEVRNLNLTIRIRRVNKCAGPDDLLGDGINDHKSAPLIRGLGSAIGRAVSDNPREKLRHGPELCRERCRQLGRSVGELRQL